MNSPIKDPVTTIIEYYDGLINEINLHTDQLLSRVKETDLLTTYESSCGPLMDEHTPYREKYTYPDENASDDNYIPESRKVRDYMNAVRIKNIEAVNKVQEENVQEELKTYEANKIDYEAIKRRNESLNRVSMVNSFGNKIGSLLNYVNDFAMKRKKSNETVNMNEEIRALAFRNRFCFLVNLDEFGFKRKLMFNLCTVVTDFYLNKTEVNSLK